MLKLFRNIKTFISPLILSTNNLKISRNSLILNSNLQLTRNLTKMPRYNYPSVRRDASIVENFHGTEVILGFNFNFDMIIE